MKKIMASVLVMLLWISVPFSSHSQLVFGQETVQSVQPVSFNLDRPYVDDHVLTGQAMADQELTVYVNHQPYQARVDSTGHYSVVLNQPVLAGDKIRVQQGMNQFEATVQEENEGLDTKIHFQGSFSLEGLVEEPAESDSTEDAEVSDEITEEEEEAEEDEEDTAEAAEEEETLQPRAPERQHTNCPNERNAACVKNGNELSSALQDRKIEKVIVLNNLNNVPSIPAVRSNTGTKILEANGYSIGMQNNGQILLNDPSIKEFYIQNASNLHSSRSSYGMFRGLRGINIHVKNSNFNTQNIPDAGYFGESWESQINFHGDVTINTSFRYAMNYRSVRVHSGANVNINGEGGIELNSNSKPGPTNSPGITVDSGASLMIRSRNNHAIYTDDPNMSFTVGPAANVHLSSSNSSSVFRLRNTSGKINIQEKARVVFDHRAGGSSLELDGSASANFNLNYPELVEFRKANTSVPIFRGRNRSVISVNVPDNMEAVRYQSNGETFDTLGPGNHISRFSWGRWDSGIAAVRDDVNLIQIKPSITPMIESINEIYNFQTAITGTATPNSEVTVTGPNNFKRTTTANSEGNFTIDVGKEMPKAGTELSFTASIYGRVSDSVSKTVQQPTVELEVSDMNFGQYKIVDKMIEATPQDGFGVRVERTPADAPFKVTAKAGPFVAGNGVDQLNNVLFFKGKNLQGASQTIMSDSAPIVKATDFELRVNPVRQFVVSNQTYTSKITWTITNGPGE